MIEMIIGLVFGSVLFVTFFLDYRSMKKNTKSLLQRHKDAQLVDTPKKTSILNGLGILLGLLTIILGYSLNDMLNLSLGIALVLMFSGQFLSLLYRNRYYMVEGGVITGGHHIKFKSVKTLRVQRVLLMKSYTLSTFNGQDMVLYKDVAEYLSQHTKKQITK